MQGRDRRGALVKIFGGLLDGAGQAVEQFEGGLGFFGGAEQFGAGQGALIGVVAGLGGGVETLDCRVVLLERCLGLRQIKMGQRPAITRLQGVDGMVVAAEQILTDAQPDSGGGAAVFARLQFVHGLAQGPMIGRVFRQRIDDLLDFLRTERSVGQHDLLDIGSGSWRHRRHSPKEPGNDTIRGRGTTAAGFARPTRASGGSRTHNPRITNAVLCQLKLRWRRLFYRCFLHAFRGSRAIPPACSTSRFDTLPSNRKTNSQCSREDHFRSHRMRRECIRRSKRIVDE